MASFLTMRPKWWKHGILRGVVKWLLEPCLQNSKQEPIAAFGETPVFSRKVCKFFIYPRRTLEEERRSLMTVERRDRNIVQRSVCLVPEQLGYQKWSEDWFRACSHPGNGQIMEQTFSSEKIGLESESVTPSCTRNHPLSTALLFHPDKSKMYAINLHGCSRTTHKNCYMGFVNDKWCLTGMPTVASSFIALCLSWPAREVTPWTLLRARCHHHPILCEVHALWFKNQRKSTIEKNISKHVHVCSLRRCLPQFL